ncbi:MAG: class I SAM-dependent methyltransferase [Candidatus Hydrogenedentes bacterium]|nr:class I SAM-dependent methyltransferase [Candidatus Hydrogenedentota bacterium]
MAEFDGWAKYYDLIHGGLPGEAEFYVGQAIRRRGSVLELGCGTGRLAIPMAMSGVHVVGLDNSKPMLDECRSKMRAVGPLPGSVRLVQADMAEFAVNHRFDLVLMAYRTFMHLLTPDRQRQCLTTIRGHLSPEGMLILNVWNPKPSSIAPHLGETRAEPELAGRYPAPGSSRTLLHYCTSAYDEHRQLITENHVVHEVDKRGTVRDRVELSLVRAWTTPREMDNLVRLCGFDVTAVFGDFDCNPLGEDSTEMIWALRPAKT